MFSSRRRHTRLQGDWSSDVCSSDLKRSKPITLAPRLASEYATALPMAPKPTMATSYFTALGSRPSALGVPASVGESGATSHHHRALHRRHQYFLLARDGVHIGAADHDRLAGADHVGARA